MIKRMLFAAIMLAALVVLSGCATTSIDISTYDCVNQKLTIPGKVTWAQESEEGIGYIGLRYGLTEEEREAVAASTSGDSDYPAAGETLPWRYQEIVKDIQTTTDMREYSFETTLENIPLFTQLA